jgi:hypothetical protein
MSITLTALMKQRYDTAANWTAANPTLLAGEIGIESDTKKWKLGDGSTAWTSLGYIPGLSISAYPLVNADISATAEIAVSKLADGTPRQLLQTDAAGTGVEWASNIDVPGTLDVTGAATFDAAVTTTGLISANGKVSFPLGTAGAPSLFPGTDTNTGIYSPGADQVAISTNGTGRLFVDANGNVGVNKSDPGVLVDILKTQNAATTLRVLNGDTGASADSRLIVGNVTTEGGLIYRGTGHGSAGHLVIFNGSTANPITFFTNGSERLRLDSSGRLGLGSSSPSEFLDIQRANGTGNLGIRLVHIGQVEYKIGINDTDDNLYITNNNANAAIGDTTKGLTITPAGNVGINTTTPSAKLNIREDVTTATAADLLAIATASGGGFNIECSDRSAANPTWAIRTFTDEPISFKQGTAERARIDSSGRLLVGTSSEIFGNRLEVVQTANNGNIGALRFTANTSGVEFNFIKSRGATAGTNTIVADGDDLTRINFKGADGSTYVDAARITAQVDGTPGGNDMPGRLVFSTTADGSSSPTERVRIDSAGRVGIGKTPASSIVGAGLELHGTGLSIITRSAGTPLLIHRTTDDGNLVEFYQDTNLEGAISVSGSTVTYGGGHLARWSQLLNDEEPSGLLKGTVMSNLDEMCEWVEEDNEQLNKTKVSDVEGDPNVAGVFVSTSFNDDGPLDFFVAMTGDMIIRIAEGVTVQRGDLLMSAGDGTAKPQDDDIIRSKTIAKVTSTHVTCTYDDGSYCVPCVLMAC